MKFYDFNKLNTEQRIYCIMFDNLERELYRQGFITMTDFNQIMKEKEEYTKKICDDCLKSFKNCMAVVIKKQGYGKKKALERYNRHKRVKHK